MSVRENIEFFARLFGQGRAERDQRIAELLASTGLAPFRDRAAKNLSGGMRQKLGICCALVHDPDFLILDEPTTGIDPLSRRQFWDLVNRMRAHRPGMSVLVATAYMEEAESFDWLIAMDAGRVTAAGSPAALKVKTRSKTIEEVFIAFLPEDRRAGHRKLAVPPRSERDHGRSSSRMISPADSGPSPRWTTSISPSNGERSSDFVGSNGCGKTTTMKMLTGLLPASDGHALLFGQPVDARDMRSRYRVGYMSQSFSLYTELTVRQNLGLHARLFHLPHDKSQPVALTSSSQIRS